ncbi:MAG: hypothetical protein AAF721_40280 [Myxococcota bacterium]
MRRATLVALLGAACAPGQDPPVENAAGSGSTSLVPDAGTTGDGAETGDGGESTTASSESTGAPPSDLPAFPLVRDSSQIKFVSDGELTIAGVTTEIRFYRNLAYACGEEGHYTFAVVSPAATVEPTPLWIFLRAGGGGYYDHDGIYHHGSQADDPIGNLEFSGDTLVEPLRRSAEAGGVPRDTLLGRRLAEGYRFMMPAPCDHDVFSGVGQPYPRSPTPNTVDGLLATMAAVDFTLANFETSSVTAHGTSAGAFGAFGLAYAYAQEETHLRAAIMDSGLATHRNRDVFELGCTFAQLNDPALEFSLLEEKIGPFFAHADLLPEVAIANGFDAVPLYVLAGGDDPRCCSPTVTVSEAYPDNCSFVHGGVTEAVADTAPNPHRSVVMAGMGHVLTDDEGPWVDDIDAWLAAVAP